MTNIDHGTNEIRELSANELDAVSGGAELFEAATAVAGQAPAALLGPIPQVAAFGSLVYNLVYAPHHGKGK